MAGVDFNLVYVMADPFKLAQVMRNFLSNALKFTPTKGRVTVHLSLLAPDDADADGVTTLRVEVVDSGPGIAKKNLPRLFNEIVQFNPGKLQNGGGSGFGLFSKCLAYTV